MITKFKIVGFKSIESAELELGNVNVFIGANGGGKSNLLEALGIIAAAAFGRVDQESLVRRGCRPGGLFRPMFRDNSPDGETVLETSGGGISYQVSLSSPPPRRPMGWEYKKELWVSAGQDLVNRPHPEEATKGDPQAGLAALKLAQMDIADPAAIFLKTLAGYSIYSPDTPVMRGLIQDPQLREPVGLSGGRLAQAAAEMMSDPNANTKLLAEFRSSFEWFEAFFSVSTSKGPERSAAGQLLVFLDKFCLGSKDHARYFFTADEVNEGALYLLLVAVVCLHPIAPKLFALDNADHGLNPVLAKRLMGTMCRWLLEANRERQVLMTTHNPLVLDGLPLQDDRVRLFIVDRDNSGATRVKRFIVTAEHRTKAAEGWTLSRMWVNGLIGGVPNV
jgi:energy-coupling factor transporter ATP-binding protein EcfA2